MDCYEKYYRRSYNALNRLIEGYKNGYDYNNMINFRNEWIKKGIDNNDVLKSEQCNLLITIMVALLGLNKEPIERTGKITKYNTNVFKTGIEKAPLTFEQQKKLDDFFSQKIISTDFDNWLSILVNPAPDKDNVDYIRRVRNSLLHSNFYVDDELGINLIHLKTKSYYEAEIFNNEFQMFVFEYFSNLERLGLTESMYLFDINPDKINNTDELKNRLKTLKITSFAYKNLAEFDEETPELTLANLCNRKGEVDVVELVKQLGASNKFEDLGIDVFSLTPKAIPQLQKFIEGRYGEDFYKREGNDQKDVIASNLQFFLNPKREISNWLIHFWYFVNGLTSDGFTPEFFLGDEYGNGSCYPTLMILKSYLVIYRLQNQHFDEIDYSKVDFSFEDTFLWCEDENKTYNSIEYYKELVKKEYDKGIITDINDVWKKVICEVIRNGLAHGNVTVCFSNDYNSTVIEIKDTNQKNNTTKCLRMETKSFEKFLNSEAFNPKNCYSRKEDELTRTRKI